MLTDTFENESDESVTDEGEDGEFLPLPTHKANIVYKKSKKSMTMYIKANSMSLLVDVIGQYDLLKKNRLKENYGYKYFEEHHKDALRRMSIEPKRDPTISVSKVGKFSSKVRRDNVANSFFSKGKPIFDFDPVMVKHTTNNNPSKIGQLLDSMSPGESPFLKVVHKRIAKRCGNVLPDLKQQRKIRPKNMTVCNTPNTKLGSQNKSIKLVPIISPKSNRNS